MTSWSKAEEAKLVNFLNEKVRARASGAAASECTHDHPRDVYFVGSLRPAPSAAEDDEARGSEIKNKISPVAFGAEFAAEPNERDLLKVQVTLEWNVYYRCFPGYREQLEFVGRRRSYSESTASEGQDAGESDHAAAAAPGNNSSESLLLRFKRLCLSATGSIRIERESTSEDWSVTTEELTSAIEDEFDRAYREIRTDSERMRMESGGATSVRVHSRVLSDKETYKEYLAGLTDEIEHDWQWEIDVELRERTTDSLNVFIQLTNASPIDEYADHREGYLFDTRAEFEFTQGDVRPYQVELAPEGFRYDDKMWGRGFNCEVKRDEDNGNRFITSHMPVYRQPRYVTRTEPEARFDDLATNPVPTLRRIRDAMYDYNEVWERQLETFQKKDKWSEEFEEEFLDDWELYKDEVRRFEEGLRSIVEDENIRDAFKLTNKTFDQSDPDKTAWRLFQIVFLVDQIRDIAALDDDSIDDSDRDVVDIIYFPTGGGKTEAYLAVLAFHAFYDRLRGKTAGVTAWTRFPLRLLTLQQTQRVADIMCVADLVRQSQSDERLTGSDIDEFAVGYFVGKEATPNELKNPDEYPHATGEDRVNWSIANDPEARQEWKRIAKCPSCRTASVTLAFDKDNQRLEHRCTNESCSFPGGRIPVYITDNEAYRYLPTVLVGTIDKLAGLGNQRKFSQLFGEVDGQCAKHGYYTGRCVVKGCRDDSLLDDEVPARVSAPTLFIQDELHLLREGLGTFDSHYESFAQHLREKYGSSDSLKVIASSATVEAFRRQASHLYGRDPDKVRVFPSSGPVLGESFYAQTLEHPQRLYVGIIPHNKTIFNAVLEVVEHYHSVLDELLGVGDSVNPYGGSLSPGTKTYRQLLDKYKTSLLYFLATRRLNALRTDLDGDVNPRREQQGKEALRIRELTGDTSTDDVARILDELEASHEDAAHQHTVLATRMVSHGVDVDRLNSMIFFGMPRENAEYIQASSRVGRKNIGLVLTCFHPIRERDRSHYSYFSKYHQFLGQLIEPVAINRWSRFSVRRTVPGLFMAVLLQMVARSPSRSGGNPNRFYFLDTIKKMISSGELDRDEFVETLKAAYGVASPGGVAQEVFAREIEELVPKFFDQILAAAEGETFVSDALIPQPMRSLRDVDEAVPIRLDETSSRRVR